jgi:hypothetical protein
VPVTLLSTGLARGILEQRHVLVRRGVEHDLRPMRGEQRLEPHGVTEVAHDRAHGNAASRGGQLAVDEVEPVLGVVQQHQLGRREARHLARQLGADRAARTGDEDPPSPEEAADVLIGLGRRCTSQQVHEPDVAHAREREPATRRQLAHRRHGLEPHARRAARLHHLAHPAARERRVGHDRGFRSLLAQHARQVGERAEHAQALDQVTGEPRIGIHEPDRLERLLARTVPPHLLDEPHGRVVGADHERAHLARAAAAEHALAPQPPREPNAAHEQQLDHPDDERERARQCRRRRECREQPPCRGRERDAARDLEHGRGARVAPQAVVEPRDPERRQGEHREPGREPRPVGERRFGHAGVEMEQKCGCDRGVHEQRVRGGEDERARRLA